MDSCVCNSTRIFVHTLQGKFHAAASKNMLPRPGQHDGGGGARPWPSSAATLRPQSLEFKL